MSSTLKSVDDEKAFGEQVAVELRQIQDPVFRVRVKRQIMGILYDAQESQHTRDFTLYAAGGPALRPGYGHTIPTPHTSHMPPQSSTPTPHTSYMPPQSFNSQSFMGMLNDDTSNTSF